MNETFISGFLGADADYKKNQNDPSKNTARLPVYNNYRDGGENKTEVINCTAWGRMADSIAAQMQYGKFLKGCAVTVSGAMHGHEYVPNKGKNAGQKTWQLQIARLEQVESQIQAGWRENSAVQQTVPSQNIPQQEAPQQDFQQSMPQQSLQSQYGMSQNTALNTVPNYGVYYEMPVYGDGTGNAEQNEEFPGGFRKAVNQVPYNGRQ